MFCIENCMSLECFLQLSRVDSRMVFVRIHCMEKCLTSFHNDVLSETK